MFANPLTAYYVISQTSNFTCLILPGVSSDWKQTLNGCVPSKLISPYLSWKLPINSPFIFNTFMAILSGFLFELTSNLKYVFLCF